MIYPKIISGKTKIHIAGWRGRCANKTENIASKYGPKFFYELEIFLKKYFSCKIF